MSHDNLVVFGSLGVTLAFFVVLTICVLLMSNKAQKQRAWLTEHGKLILATVIQTSGSKPSSGWKGLWELIWGILELISLFGGQQHVQPATADSTPSRRVVAQWVHPETKQRYEFHADIPLRNARRYRVRKTIPVLIDEQHPDRYWMAPPDIRPDPYKTTAD